MARTPRTPRPSPTLDTEHTLWAQGHQVIAGMDEVGRGAWAGPMSIGVALLSPSAGPAPAGLADSKYLSERKREAMVPVIQAWVLGWAVGEVSPAEVDHLGVTAALRLAGRRALDALPVAADVVVLDGAHDYLTCAADGPLPRTGRHLPPVVTQVKADAHCAVVSAASVLAKSTRDRQMAGLGALHPGYGWERNAGYAGAAEHLAGVAAHGLTPWHRRSWRLPAALEGVVTPQAPGSS